MVTWFPLSAAAVPIAMITVCAWLWWDALRKPWLFVLVAAIGLCIVFGAIVVRLLSSIGIAGVQPGSLPGGDSASQPAVLALLLGVVIGGAFLWAMKLVFSK